MADASEIHDSMIEIELSVKYQCYSHALKLLTEILEAHPDYLPAKETLQTIYHRTGELDKAQEVARQIILIKKRIADQTSSQQRKATDDSQTQKRQLIERIDAIIREIYDCNTFEQVLKVSSAQLLDHLQSDRCLIVLQDRISRSTSTHEYCSKGTSTCLDDGLNHLSQLLLQKVTGTLNEVTVDEAQKDPDLVEFRTLLAQYRIHSILAHPLIYKSASMGVVILHRCKRPVRWSEPEKALFSTVSGHMAVAMGNAMQLTEAQTMAFTDKLTGIDNRRFLEEKLSVELRNARQQQYPLSFVVLDVDHFKMVNDTFGHGAGDKVLQKLAYLLKTHLRKGDTVARFGGEEFAIILPNTPLGIAHRVVDNIRKLVEAAVSVEPGSPITVSAGVMEAEWKSSRSMEEVQSDLIQKADGHLYRAKRSGRNRVCSAADLSIPSDTGGSPMSLNAVDSSPNHLSLEGDPLDVDFGQTEASTSHTS
jgi:diguanylate cyclase (GGDEF)-like protein